MDALYVGALRATNNRGLQPAMDHILENEGKPIPDPSTAAPTSASGSAGQPMDVDVDVDDDEDEDALRRLMGAKTGATSSSEAEPKVCLFQSRLWHLHRLTQ